MSLELPNLPSVVLDTCVVRGCPADSRFPDGFNYVLTDATVQELASTGTGGGAVSQMRRFLRWCRTNADQLFVAKYWQDVSRGETVPGRAAARSEVIQWNLTTQLRDGLLIEPEMVPGNIPKCTEAIAEHLTHKQQFVQIMEERTSALRAANGPQGRLMQDMRESRDDRVEYLRGASLDVWLGNLPADSRWRTPPWSRVVGEHPDVHAIGRWFRLLEWYSALHVIGLTKGFDNSFEDAIVSWTSSYFDYLVTSDSGCMEAAEAAFPDVTVLRSVADLPSEIQSLEQYA